MNHYKHLTSEQRYQICALLKTKISQSEIARAIGVSKSTISRELARNKGKRGYRPKQAHSYAMSRKAVINPTLINSYFMRRHIECLHA